MTLTVLFDFKSPQAYLALRPTLALLDELQMQATWKPLLVEPLKAPVMPPLDADRGTLHRWHRARYQEMDLNRYARGLDVPAANFAGGGLYRQSRGETAALGYLWVQEQFPAGSISFLRGVFEGYWHSALDVDSREDVESQITACGAQSLGFSSWCEEQGAAELARMLGSHTEQGYFSVPGYVVDGEVYYGRQQLPMVRWCLTQRAGRAPV